MTAIASLLSTTAVTLPGAPAPAGVTPLASFPDLAVAPTECAAVPAASGRQAIAGSGKALPVASGETDALAWLGSTLGGVDGQDQTISSVAAAVQSPITAGNASQASAPVMTATSVSLGAKGIIFSQAAPSFEKEMSAIARPIAASSGHHAIAPDVTSADNEILPLHDIVSSETPSEAADDGGVADPEQPGDAQGVELAQAPTLPPAAMTPIIPASTQQAATPPIEQPEVLRPLPPLRLEGHATSVRRALPAGEAAAGTLSTALQPTPRAAAFVSLERNDIASEGGQMAVTPLSSEAGVSSDIDVPAAIPLADHLPPSMADRATSAGVTSTSLQATARIPEQTAGNIESGVGVRASASIAATPSSVADASVPTITPKPSRIRPLYSTVSLDPMNPAQGRTLVAGAEARVPLVSGVPLPVAMPVGGAAAIDAALQPPSYSPASFRPLSSAQGQAVAREIVTSATITPDASVAPASEAARAPATAASGFVTAAAAPPATTVANDAAGSLASPLPIAAPGEQPVPRTTVAPAAIVRDAAPALRVAIDVPALPIRPTSAPAAQVFAAAIHRALGEQDARQPGDPVSAPLAPAIPGITAAGAVQQGALDMRHEHWPAAMIERIVTLRDMAAENDTRLRLSPDMLGTIDVSLKRDGDQVQVQITAEQAQTRQLLAEAQPRLVELADARGVKLQLSGGHAGGAGQQPGPGNSGGGDAPRQHAPASPFSNRPRSSAERAATDDTDQRIA
ncbi:flagellar hook-length control protein FliK [Sphingomonas sp. Mn802worker]|uniref:flagellar hook-length control protein FliK n=1 Tax=Sphingomonas sp. Mn802worker TaxID=629773 RepID=UPI00036ADE86|nr:flagellar hook-length control protein FliK [Sphingomonas sp. Mn802worker]